LNIRGMSMVDIFLAAVNRFGQGLLPAQGQRQV